MKKFLSIAVVAFLASACAPELADTEAPSAEEARIVTAEEVYELYEKLSEEEKAAFGALRLGRDARIKEAGHEGGQQGGPSFFH